MTLQIDPAFRALIPPLTAEERQQLEKNLRRDGCRDPLVVWNGLLLDGHHRFEICTAHHLPFTTIEQPCADRDAATIWIIENQFGRRNLAPYQIAELALLLEPLYAGQMRERQGHGKTAPGRTLGTDLSQASKKPSTDTRTRLAKITGMSEGTIQKAKFIKTHAPEEVKQDLRKRKTTIDRAYHTLRQTVARRLPPITPAQNQLVEAILDQYADGDFHRLATIAEGVNGLEADVLNVLEHMLRDGTYNTTVEKRKGGVSWSYRLVRGHGRTVDVDILALELNPIVQRLKAEGNKHTAKWSQGTIALLAHQLQTTIERLIRQPLPTGKPQKEDSYDSVQTH